MCQIEENKSSLVQAVIDRVVAQLQLTCPTHQAVGSFQRQVNSELP